MRPLFIGYTDGKDRLQLTAKDLETHVHGIGGTRSGKSKLIEWIGRDLIRNEQGALILDPHGYLYEDLVRWLAYVEPNREVILFNPSSDGRIVGFNPFLARTGDLGTRVDRLIRVTIKAWGVTDTDDTPTLERWLRCMYHVMLESGLTIEILPYLFSWTHRDIASFLKRSVTNRLIQDEWAAFDTITTMKEFDGQIGSSKNKLFRFLTSDQTRRIMGLSTNNIDMEDIIENGKILLVNLQPSDVLSDQQSRLIGSLLLNEIWEVGMRRGRAAAGKPPKSFYLIIDEFQKFLTPDIPDMLDQGAKYGIHLLLFHQRLDQLRMRDEEAYSAVMTNARTKLVFGALSREDARTMTEAIFPGQVDMKQVKHEIRQTKFWPVYGRDTVYSRGSGEATGAGQISSLSWNPTAEEWVPSMGTTDNILSSLQEGTADIPFLRPEPFTEVSSVQFYSLEEVLWQMTDQLMEQYQRHFMIRRPGQPTVGAITPYVNSWYVRPERAARYIDKLLGDFLHTKEVDQLLESQRLLLESTAKKATEPIIVESSGPTTKRRAPAAKQSPKT